MIISEMISWLHTSAKYLKLNMIYHNWCMMWWEIRNPFTNFSQTAALLGTNWQLNSGSLLQSSISPSPTHIILLPLERRANELSMNIWRRKFWSNILLHPMFLSLFYDFKQSLNLEYEKQILRGHDKIIGCIDRVHWKRVESVNFVFIS